MNQIIFYIIIGMVIIGVILGFVLGFQSNSNKDELTYVDKNYKDKVFIFNTSHNEDIKNKLRNDNFKKKIMGEIIWIHSLFSTLNNIGFKCLILNNNELKNIYQSFLNKQNLYFIFERDIIKENKYILEKKNIYKMCYWGRNDNNYNKLNILTPFNYNNNNTFLGYNMEYLLKHIKFNKYNTSYGILWGKNIENININLVKYLCSKGLKFYSTNITPNININGVYNLGLLPKDQWCQLLNDCKFILGSGTPSSGPTILESMFYKTIMFGPKHQFPVSTHNNNIYFIDNLEYKDIYNLLIKKVNFKTNEITNNLISEKEYIKRIKNIFNL